MHTKTKRILAAAGTVAVIAGAVFGFSRLGSAAREDTATAEQAQSVSSAAVERRDLAEQEELSGTLGYGSSEEISLNRGGTITSLPELGTVVDRGGTLLSIDGVPVQLWLGETPLWRQLDSASDDGHDILEIEYNLVALGFAPDDDLTVDEDWTSTTTRAVKAWQESRGVEETGTISPGDVVMWPTAVRIASHTADLGAQATGPIVSVTGAAKVVTVDLDASKRSLVNVDDAVEVVIPGGAVLEAVVSEVGNVAQSSDDSDPLNPSDPTIEVVISITDPAAADLALDQAPVTVRVTTSAAKDVLAVPVDALLALSGGGFAVEKVTGTTTELVAVETGAFADGWIEITGDIAEGDEVVVPS